MSKIQDAIENMINNLVHIGYTTEQSIDMVNNNLEKAKKEIDDYWEWVESRIDSYCNQ